MIYATFADYTDIYLGRVIPSEEVFNRLSLRASAEIDRLTFGRAARFRLRDSEGKLILACCAVCEKLYALEEAAAGGAAGGVAEEQVGDHRVKFRTWSGVTAGSRVEIAALLELYLFGTGLLTRAVSCLEQF